MSVQYFENEKIFMLQGRKSTYAFEIQDGGAVCNLHWGGKVNDVIDLPTTKELVNHISTARFHRLTPTTARNTDRSAVNPLPTRRSKSHLKTARVTFF